LSVLDLMMSAAQTQGNLQERYHAARLVVCMNDNIARPCNALVPGSMGSSTHHRVHNVNVIETSKEDAEKIHDFTFIGVSKKLAQGS